MDTAAERESGTIFKWETLREIEPAILNTRPPVPGKMYEVELTNGEQIQVWRGDDGTSYFCHGLTFDGKEAPGGPISPFTGKPVETILRGYFKVLDFEMSAKPGDIFVWWSPDPFQSTPHSAILTELVVAPGQSYFDYKTTLRTKNGLIPEMEMTFGQLVGIYGETYKVYTRK